MVSLSSAALFGVSAADVALDAAATNVARESDPAATPDAVADRVSLTKAAVQMAVAAKLLRVEKETRQALVDVMA